MITYSTIDMSKLKNALQLAAQEIKGMKAILRESGQPAVSWITYKNLRDLKKTATLLCALRAHLRGKVHLKGMDLERQAAYIQPVLANYAVAPLATAA